ncbi:hypothetical protein FRC08_009025 [Ceratobasidium sp. 394]|nr:hypothetical protein FRC08_009025 [Ceratobasidium sp. 394]KAG9078799.1 hypothetical protein FS749_009140 [Ceratobasidium sp. UAMH 11750]
MRLPDPVLLHISRREISSTNIAGENGRTIAWVVAVLIAAILVVAIWCIIKVWGSRARNARAEQELGITSLPPPRRRFMRSHRTRQVEESLPVYDPRGRPPAFSPTGASLGMPPPAYLPGDANGREVYRRESPSLASIAEKDEEAEDEKKETTAPEVTRRASV